MFKVKSWCIWVGYLQEFWMNLVYQWRIQEYHGPGAVEFVGSSNCFDVPFIHTLCFSDI